MYIVDDEVDSYSKLELENLWTTGFSERGDAAQMLAGFAGCQDSEAAEMIQEFRTTAAARRAAQAEQKRRQAADAAPAENATEPRKKATGAKRKRKFDPDPEPDPVTDAEIAEFAPDSLLASLVNDIHGFSEIKAFGKNKYKIVIIERFGGLFRMKRTSYQYFRDFDSALQAARNEHIRLKLF